MTSQLDTVTTLGVIPAQRTAPRAEVIVDAISGGDGAELSHHLLDINLQIFESVEAAAERILERRHLDRGLSVFTCNVDHLMLTSKDEAFRSAYARADVVTIDGAPLALLSKWTGTSSASRVTGVDLTMALVERAAEQGLKVALVGGASGRGEQAAANLREQYPALPEMFVDSPRMGFSLHDDEDARLVAALRSYGPDVVIVCLGAPKQELWIDQHRADLPGAAMIGAGATIDFLSGHQSRAPRVFQRTGTEAIYRLVTDFRRLWRRYLLRDTRFLVLFAVLVSMSLLARTGIASSERSHPVGSLRRMTGQKSAVVCDACRHR